MRLARIDNFRGRTGKPPRSQQDFGHEGVPYDKQYNTTKNGSK